MRAPNQFLPYFSHLPQEQQQQQCDPHGRIQCRVGVGAAVVLLLAVTQTSLLLVQTYALPHTCETKINSSDCREIAAESENRSIYFQVIELLRIIFSFMTFPEYAFLVHGLYKLLIKTSNVVHKSLKHPSLKPIVYLRKLFGDLRAKKLKRYCRAWMGIILGSVFVVIFTLCSLVSHIMDMVHAVKINECCKEQPLVFILFYESVHLINHTLSPLIVAGMVVTVLEVKAIWFHIDMDDKLEPDRVDDTGNSTLTHKEKTTVKEHYKCVTEYKQRIAKIKPLFRVFQTWFVFQWFHYFFQTVTDFTQTIHQWITGTHHPMLVIAYRGIHTAFDILAFGIPHVCGLKLNDYHQQYLRDVKRKQLKDTESILQYAKAYSLTIEKDNDGDFVPRIPGTGIKIPLHSPGYTLGILLTIFALISSFVGFSM